MHKFARINKTKKGFTLAEFIFVALTLALFLMALFQVTRGGLRAYTRGVVQTEMKHQLRDAVDKISTDLRQAQPGTSTITSPNWTHGNPTALESDLEFRRAKWRADGGYPYESILIEYNLVATRTISIGGVTYNLGNLTRRENATSMPGGTDTTSTIAEDIVISDSASATPTSGFRWIPDPANTATNNNIYVLEVKLKILRTHQGSSEPELLETSTRVAVRSKNQIGSGFDSFTTAHPYSNIQRFGEPTSLKKPFSAEGRRFEFHVK